MSQDIGNSPSTTMESGLGAQLESFRAARRNLEASVLPLATSVDGRRFSFQASRPVATAARAQASTNRDRRGA